jgi:hypothetical protein
MNEEDVLVRSISPLLAEDDSRGCAEVEVALEDSSQGQLRSREERVDGGVEGRHHGERVRVGGVPSNRQKAKGWMLHGKGISSCL